MSPNHILDQIFGTVSGLIYLLQRFFKFYLLPLIDSRVLFDFFEFIYVDI